MFKQVVHEVATTF